MTIGMEWDDWEWRVVDSDLLPSHPMRGSEIVLLAPLLNGCPLISVPHK